MPEPDSKQPLPKMSMPEALAKLREIRQGLETLVTDLHSNIEAFNEDPDFQDRRVDLQQNADERAMSLEKEVKRLRSDVKSIRDLLGEDADEKSADSS